jgi:phosphomannomutase
MTLTLIERARQWAETDPDPATRLQAEALIAAGDPRQLEEHFGGLLEFGTAGLRAKVGPGSLRMNAAVVRQATWAVAQDLLAAHRVGKECVVVLAYDARLSSRQLAEETAGVLVAAGIRVRYFTEPTATPIAAFALLRFQAAGAIVITASHNPPEYNGYKLYAANGAQIISPTDARVAALMARAPGAKNIATGAGALEGRQPLATPVEGSLLEAYFSTINDLRPKHAVARDLRIVYTPLHGVGGRPVTHALASAGFTQVSRVNTQFEPDGHFPTVNFPNPEEAGAMDLALAQARAENADIILANDPDVDRLAACVRGPSGDFLQLSGNQIGLLLADYQLGRYTGKARAMVLQSIVSSPMLESIARGHGAHFEQTLTGFKWVWNAALKLRELHGYHFVFGFEEALGYSAEDIVRDKDGISAALLFAEMSAEDKAAGGSVIARLERLYRQHGLWVSLQRSVTRNSAEGLKEIQEAVQRIGAAPPREVSGISVTEVRDFRTGQETRPAWLENTPLLELRLGARGRVLVRPSGTEPKLKVYVDLCEPVDASTGVWAAEQPALARARAIADQVVAACGL